MIENMKYENQKLNIEIWNLLRGGNPRPDDHSTKSVML